MSLQISFKRENDIPIICLKGQFVGSEAEYFLREIEHKLDVAKEAILIVDLTELDYLGTQGASALLSLASKYQVKIAHPSLLVKETLEILKFDKFFEIYDEVKDAVASCGVYSVRKYDPE